MTKNILITGGAGYIGSHISEILVKKQKKIVVVDNLSTGYKRLINKKAKFYRSNILSTKKIRKIITKHRIDSIIHLAASLSIGIGEKYPKIYYKNNVLGTKSVISACKNTSVKNLIFSSTAAVYKDGYLKVSERSKISPKSVYGKTKLKAEKLITQKCKKYKINYGILRYFNIVGASPSGKIGLINKGDHLFKNLSSEFFKTKPIFKIYGNDYKTKDGTTIRDYIHVSDIAEVHHLVLEKIDKFNISKILNCGYGTGLSVKNVINNFIQKTNKKIFIKKLPRRKGDMIKIVADVNKLKKFIKWKPKFNKLNIMVKSSLDWEKKQ